MNTCDPQLLSVSDASGHPSSPIGGWRPSSAPEGLRRSAAPAGSAVKSVDLVKLGPLMDLTSGIPEIVVGLIDGPVAIDLGELATEHIRNINGGVSGACSQAPSIACLHGTFIAGILSARRGIFAPALCPDCTLIVRPIFTGSTTSVEVPSASPRELASAIEECIEAGARVINLSLALEQSSTRAERELEQALDRAAARGVIIVAAAGNQGTLGTSAITRHPWVIPVAAYDRHARPMNLSNIGPLIAKRGLGAPGDSVTSLDLGGRPLTLTGTSAAAPFITGTIAMLWSLVPTATAALVKYAVMQANGLKRRSVIPPLLDAWKSYQYMVAASGRR